MVPLSRWRNDKYVERLKQGDIQLQQELYDDFAHSIYGSISRLIPDIKIRESMVVEVFACIFRRLPSTAGPHFFFGWMFGIVLQHILRWHESQ